SNPRRLLILSPSTQSTSIIPPFLHSLTGTPVTDPPTSRPTTQEATGDKPSETSFAGYTTHAPFSIRNKYYSAEVPVWVDEVPFSFPGTGPETGDSLRKDKQGEEEGKGSEQTPPSPSLWKTEFCSAEAKVVRDAIGGIVVCVLNPEDHTSTLPSGSDSGEDPRERPDVQSIKEYIQSIASVKAKIEEERETISDVAGLVVLVGKKQPGNSAMKSAQKGNDDEGILDDLSPEGGDDEQPFTPTWWEDQLSDIGVMEFEVVDWDPRSDGEEERRNKFGELQGMRRIKEVLETHDWASNPEDRTLDDDLEEHLLGLDDDDDTDGFNFEVNELEREMLGLRMAIGQDEGEEQMDDEKDEENKVDSIETLMLRMQAIKDMSADLPENERKTFAAKAVKDIMKEL
ncbi:hypothetical protein PHISCL_10205, partial [Aspergillus sclerotialis]